MAIKYGNLHVDEKYKPTILPNLFYRTWMVPGVTFQDVSTDSAGGWFWHKLTSSGAAEPGTPGRDFTDEAAADTLVQAVFNNNFQRSKKIYGVQASAVTMPVANEHLGLAIKEVAEGKNLSGLACLVNEGTVSGTTTAITADNFDKQILAERQAVVEAKGVADVVLCSPAFFATMLEKAGAKYTPTTNEMLLAAAAGGQVGNYLGMTWIEVNGFAHSKDISYYDFSSTKKTVTAAELKLVDFIMYDHNAFGAGDNFTMARLRDSERFAGVLAQTEDNVAFKVLEPTVVRVRKHAASA